MCDPVGWEAALPKGFTMPPGYTLEGMRGMDSGPSVYYWCKGTRRFGPNELDKRTAVRQAWRDHKSGGTDPTAVEYP